jgi:hydroxymethylbilane synthase
MTRPHTRAVRIGTRGSELARWQADFVAGLMRSIQPEVNVEIIVLSTRGDQVLDTPLPLLGGKGLFTAELEDALKSGRIDFAVHSLKDLPTEAPPGLTIGAYPERATVRDALVSRNGTRLEDLPPAAVIGTSSRRRAAQLLAYRPQLSISDIRGNVPTRLRKVSDPDGPYDATILAEVGLERLGRLQEITQVLPLEVMLPAPGQGALGIQCRDDPHWLEILHPLNHMPTQLAVTAERAFLTGLGGGCAVPIAAYGTVAGRTLELRGRISALDGSHQVEVTDSRVLPQVPTAAINSSHQLGLALAQRALEEGACAILEGIP